MNANLYGLCIKFKNRIIRETLVSTQLTASYTPTDYTSLVTATELPFNFVCNDVSLLFEDVVLLL